MYYSCVTVHLLLIKFLLLQLRYYIITTLKSHIITTFLYMLSVTSEITFGVRELLV